MLRCLVGDHPHQWDLVHLQAEFAFNCMVNPSTGFSPFTVVYTKALNLLVDLLPISKHSHRGAAQIADKISSIHQQILDHLQEANARYKADANKHRRPQVFHPGDLVMIHLNKQCLQHVPNSKLHPRCLGPFSVKTRINDNAYVIDLPSTLQFHPTFNVSELTQYHAQDDAPIEISRSSSFQQDGIDAEHSEVISCLIRG
ncbi:hypothetical protein Sjap_018822 [Stephania japonica]|uniref:Tf2-1-like SH3-like domain-containing protein n=1 Tax=Stephania japonica TaxID=461633 RepID=A0AAP0I8Q3_9MAGN